MQKLSDKDDEKPLLVGVPFETGDRGSIQYGSLSHPEDDVPLISDAFRDPKKGSKCLTIIRTLTIEPVIFAYICGFFIIISCLSNMMMDKGCYYHLNYTTEICKNLSFYDEEKKVVEALANDYSMYANLMSLIAALSMIFIAPWSDKYGRKLPLYLCCFGTILSDIGLILCTVYFDSRLEYLILARIPGEIVGGFICVLTIVYSHASETSSDKNRTLKYTTVQLALGLGMSLGMLVGGMVYRYLGYFYVYLTATLLQFFCLPWVYFVVQETKGLDSKITWSEKLKDFFVCESFTTGFKATVRPRPNKERTLLLLLLASVCTIILNYESFGTIAYIYVHDIYNWGPSTYSVVSTAFSITQLVVMILAVPLLVKIFKIDDSALGLIGTISMMGKNVLIAFAKYHVLIYYSGNVFGFLSPLPSLSVRSTMSKILDKEELGRVFAFVATCESIVPMVGTIAITKVFNATMRIVPSISYLMTVIVLMLPLGTFIWTFRDHKRSRRRIWAIDSKKNFE